MKSETVTRGTLTLRKEAIVGIKLNVGRNEQDAASIQLFLIGGQTIDLDFDNPVSADTEFKRWKALAALDKDS